MANKKEVTGQSLTSLQEWVDQQEDGGLFLRVEENGIATVEQLLTMRKLVGNLKDYRSKAEQDALVFTIKEDCLVVVENDSCGQTVYEFDFLIGNQKNAEAWFAEFGSSQAIAQDKKSKSKGK